MIALLESLACGLPAVTTNIGAIPDYVDESCAALVPSQSPEVMYEAVRELLANDSQRRSLAQNARQRALQFNWPNIMAQMREIYSQILN